MKTVKDLIKELKALDPNLPVIYAIDEEGNGFDYLYHSPTIGWIDDNKDFYSDGDDKPDGAIKCVCVN